MKTKDFAIVALFPDELDRRVDALRRELSERFGPKQALVWPPHLTLRTGFRVPEDEIAMFIDAFEAFSKKLKSVRVKLKGFSFYDNFPLNKWITSPYVVSIDVEKTRELFDFHSELLGFTEYAIKKDEKTEDWNPHVTMAYNDIDENVFRNYKDYLEGGEFEGEFELTEVAIDMEEDHSVYKKLILGSG